MPVKTFTEFVRVRVLRTLQVEGCRVPQGMVGTVVSIYGDGEAYAVEFENLGDGMEVVTLAATDLVEAADGTSA